MMSGFSFLFLSFFYCVEGREFQLAIEGKNNSNPSSSLLLGEGNGKEK